MTLSEQRMSMLGIHNVVLELFKKYQAWIVARAFPPQWYLARKHRLTGAASR